MLRSKWLNLVLDIKFMTLNIIFLEFVINSRETSRKINVGNHQCNAIYTITMWCWANPTLEEIMSWATVCILTVYILSKPMQWSRCCQTNYVVVKVVRHFGHVKMDGRFWHLAMSPFSQVGLRSQLLYGPDTTCYHQ